MIRLLALALLLASCKSGQSHIATAIAKDPTLLNVERVVFQDTIVLGNTKGAFVLQMPSDGTAVAERTHSDIAIDIVNVGDTALSVEVECPPDTQFVEQVKYVPQVKYVKRGKREWVTPLVLGAFLGGLAVLVLLR